MRIAILTQPLRYNYGGILQNFALQTVLRRMGHEVVTIDPQRYRYTRWQHLKFIVRHFIGRYIRGHKHTNVFEEWNIDKPTRLLGTNTFKFVDRYIKRKEFTDLFIDVKPDDFDAFIVGSDQVWRPEYNPNITNMFLDFTQGWDVKRIAYAASFGIDTWRESGEKTKRCKELLQRFDFVSVREDSGVTLCKNVFNVEATHVLDPTLLLTKEDYIKLVKRKGNLDTMEGELYLYLLDENKSNMNLAYNISKEMGVTPYTYTSRACDFHGVHSIEERIQPPVELWIKGFDQAKIVLTDSFHACVFSIIFRKQFYLYSNKDRGMARYSSLFHLLGINDRYVQTIEDVFSLKPIDFDAVHKKLRCLQGESLLYLTNALKKCN